MTYHRPKPPSVWETMQKVPPFITALVTIGCVIGTGMTAYFRLLAADEKFAMHLIRLDEVIKDGKSKREADHDVLIRMVGNVEYIRDAIQRMEERRKASLQE